MPRFLEALHFISGRIPNTNTATKTPPSPSIIATDALSTALDIINNHIPSQVKAAISTFLQDKSQSEVLFLASILLAVVLFVVILPVAEALFGIDMDGIDNNDDEQQQGLSRSSSIEQHSSSGSPSKMKMYKPGVGVVEVDVEEVTTSETTLRRGSSNGSRCGSILSGGSMETIEESEEEDEVGSEDDDDDLSSIVEEDDTTQRQQQRHVHVHVTPTKSVRFKQDQKEVVSPLPPPKDLIFATGRSESVADKTKYYEFLHFINSENDSPLGGRGKGDGQRKKVSFDTTRGDQQVNQQEGGEIVKNGNNNPFAELLALRNTKEDNNKSYEHPSSPTQEVHVLSDDDDGDEVSSLESPIPSPPPSPYMEDRTKLSTKSKSSKNESFKHKLSSFKKLSKSAKW